MSQSKKHSISEAITSTTIGYIIAVTTQSIVFPWFGLTVPLEKNLAIGSIFTVISIIRIYLIRRIFNGL